MIEKLNRCIELQKKFNTSMNPQWMTAGYAWKRAMWVEAAELADHIGYKWWKNVNAKQDREQILLELVDIFHFLLSDIIINSPENILPESLIHTNEFVGKHTPFNADKEDCLKAIEDFVFDCIEDRRNVVKSYFTVVRNLGFQFDEVIDYYLGKNALNLFRLDHGYKSGTYVKLWQGKEDNVILDEILKTGERDFEKIYLALNDRYMQNFVN
jgi:dimeric dUTPase (all-alpha-NTP-PPase superfamily)